MKFKVVVLGAGVGRQHVTGYQSLPDHYEVYAVCDRDAVRAAELAATVSGCKIETDINAVLADPCVDIVSNCLPPHLHAEVSMAALDAGKHVVSEKPIAGSIGEAERLLSVARASGKRFVPVFQYRYGHSIAQLNALISCGLAGDPLVATLETHWNRSADYYGVDWRGTWDGELGGAIVSHAIHGHDLLCDLFGEVTHVSAALATKVNSIETEDCAALILKTTNGGLATSSTTLGASDDRSRLRLVYRHITVDSGHDPYAPGQDVWSFSARDPANQASVDKVAERTKNSLAAIPQGFAGQFLAIAQHLNGRNSPMVTPEDGLRSIELATAIYLADRTGREIALPLERHLPICEGWALTHS
ncbi:MAG: Gfo/Idh/MocA family protein [Hyphomicrobiaceae bacterium]